MKRALRFFLCAWLVGSAPNAFSGQAAGGKTYKLRDGDLWVSGRHKKSHRLTSAGKIKSFSISPTGKYAACQKVLKTVDEYSDDTDAGPAEVIGERDLCSILIVDLTTGKVVHELKISEKLPATFDSLGIVAWEGDRTLKFIRSDGRAADTFVYDVVDNKVDGYDDPESVGFTAK